MINHSVLIADSGSTKTDWAWGSNRIHTQGLNPFHQDEDTIRSILRNELLPNVSPAEVLTIQFYGSGVRPELEEKMQRLLQEVFPKATHIEAHGDLLGAARALCGQKEGIACILGTGSNSCLYDGQNIIKNTPPMGYVLGDEGSGAVLGIRFLNALYKNRLSDQMRVAFETYAEMSMPQIIARVYRQPMANRWLASLSAFIHQHLDDPAVNAIVEQSFIDFIRHNIAPYQRKDLPISAVGSIAYYYQEQLSRAANHEGYTLGLIMRSPLDSLI